MRKHRSFATYSSLLFLLMLLSIHSARGQSTLMNVPSSEVLPARQVYVEMDFITNYAWQRDDNSKFQNYIPRVVVGIGKNVEVGANVSFTHVPAGGAPVELQPNIKWKFYNNEGQGIGAAVGCIWYVPLTHRSGTRTFGQCYTVVSKKFGAASGPRFTGGPYALVNSGGKEGTRFGAIVGYEQPFSNQVGLIIDWSSGNNRLGYVSPGLWFKTSRKSTLSTGYSIANQGRGKNALFAYYGWTF